MYPKYSWPGRQLMDISKGGFFITRFEERLQLRAASLELVYVLILKLS
jgi:hypothetical protein